DCAAQGVEALVQRLGLVRLRPVTAAIAAPVIERRTAIDLPAGTKTFVKHDGPETRLDQCFGGANACRTSTNDNRIKHRTHFAGSVTKAMPSSRSVVQARSLWPSAVMT